MSIDMIFIAGLIIASGFFSLFKEALKAAQKPRMQAQADEFEKRGKLLRAKSIRRGMEAVEHPGKHLAAARIWISVLRTLAAIFAGFNLEHMIYGAHNAGIPFPLAVAAVTAAIALAILLFGDLAPGVIARATPEKITVNFLPLFEAFTLPLRPLFFLANAAGKAAGKGLRPLFKLKQTAMTEDELRNALMEGEKSGIVESKERKMVEGVFYLGDRSLGAFMSHRSEIQWLDINDPPQNIRAKVLEFRSQRCFPVADGSLDAIIGAAYLEDVILNLASDRPLGLRSIMKKALFAPETMPALKAFETFRRGETSYIFVMDEYGGFAGMVWLQDLMEEIVGELTAPVNEGKQAVQLEDGSWLIDGTMNTDDAASLLVLPGLADSGDYHTLAGFVLSLAGELPHAGDSFNYCGCRFTVLDMDGNRIDKIGVKKDGL